LIDGRKSTDSPLPTKGMDSKNKKALRMQIIRYQDSRSMEILPGESGVVPLAFPLLAGPGAITSVIISYQAYGFVVTIFSIAIVIGITYVILLFVNPIYKLLGRRGSMIVTRVFAIFVAAIAIQYVIEGAKRLFV
jgi:multiple antibiotic resistance protein